MGTTHWYVVIWIPGPCGGMQVSVEAKTCLPIPVGPPETVVDALMYVDVV